MGLVIGVLEALSMGVTVAAWYAFCASGGDPILLLFLAMGLCALAATMTEET